MKVVIKPLVLLLVLASVGAAGAQGEKIQLLMKAEAGQVSRYQTDGTINIDFGGMKAALEVKETDKITVVSVVPSGEITTERVTEAVEISFNGQKAPSPDAGKDTETRVIKADGSLVSLKTTSEGDEERKMSVRMFPVSNPVFPEGEVGPGDKWSREFKADPATGVEAGKADYELLAFEKVGGVETAKIKLAYRETSGTPALSSTGTVWVEKTSGDTVAADYEVENVPFGMGDAKATGSGKMHQERIAGGPLGAPKGEDGKPIPPKEKTIDDVVKDFEKLPGLFTLYRKQEAGRDTVYLELREDQLDRLFFLQATASTGTAGAVVAGDPLNDLLFKFQRGGPEQILMVTPNINFVASSESPIARSVKRSFAPGYLEAFKIEAKHPERKSLLLNISDLFRGDVAQIASMLGGGGGALAALGLGGGGSYSLDKEKTHLAALKAFPENLYVETQYHFTRGGRAPSGLAALLSGSSELADPRSVPLRVNFNLFELKETGYQPRIADSRVGYFYTEYQDFSDDAREDPMVRYILRWDVRKKDPSAALSEPVQPIVFWLDHAIPTEYRPAVSEGLLMWNRAFEKVGIKNAVQVKQMPDDAEWDHADMRYNVIRWSTTQNPPYGAVALFRVNPLTGQILNAGITVDASLTRDGKLMNRELVDPAQHFQPEAAPAAIHPHRCELALGALEQKAYGSLALDLLQAAGTPVDKTEFTNSFVRAIVAHEMGHILGLFHNFAASTQLSLEELKDPKKVREIGAVGSVMDYVPFNIAAIKQQDPVYWTPTLGLYDLWAVEYGYTPKQAASPEGERGWLKGVAAKGNLPGHAFHNDLVADQFDPLVSRFDLSREPLEYWTRNLQVSRHLLFHLSPRLPHRGESYYQFTRAFNILMNQYARSAAVASRYVGGLHLNRNFRGDADEKPVVQPVDGEKQREALRLLNTYIFAENAFRFPEEYWKKLSTHPFPSFSSMIRGTGADFPVRDQMSRVQTAALRRLFNPTVLTRLANNEFREPGRSLPMPELFATVSDSVWAELAAGKNVDPLRRSLQRAHLDLLVEMTVQPGGSLPEDAKMLAWDRLRQLKTKLTAAKRPGQDDYTRIHLDECDMRIDRALNAVQTIGGGAAPSVNPLSLLLGGESKKPD